MPGASRDPHVPLLGLLGAVALTCCNAAFGVDDLGFGVAASSSSTSTVVSSGSGGAVGSGGGSSTTTSSSQTTGAGAATSASTTGSGGSSTGGGAGTGGSGGDGDPPCVPGSGANCLVSEGLIVRYFLDEAGSGTLPIAALDAAPTPLDLPADYSDGHTYTSQSGNRGVSWPMATTNGGARGSIAGTKLETRLDGSTTATIELVAQITGTSMFGSPITYLGDDANLGHLTVYAAGTGAVMLASHGGQKFRRWFTALDTRVVLHVVVDTSFASVDARARLYVNGNMVTPETGDQPMAQNEAIDIPANQSLRLGNYETIAISPQGTLFYAAYYDHAMSAAEVSHNAGRLANDDDGP